jgi:formate hydrogenlyase subunit 4
VDLFLYQYSSYVKLCIYAIVEASLFYPFAVQNSYVAVIIFMVVIAALATTLAAVETVTARFKLKFVPQYLLFATAIGVLNLLIWHVSKAQLTHLCHWA